MTIAHQDDQEHPDEPYLLLRVLSRPRAVLRRQVSLAWRRRLAIFVGGVAGTGLRIAVGLFPASSTGWPWGTFVANITGALALGYLLTRFLEAAPRTTLTIPLVCQGVIGSYTTFSAFSLEVWRLFDAGRVVMGLGYGVGSAALGVAVARLGVRVAEARA